MEKTHKLESVGVEWEIKPHNEVPWGTRFTELARFVRAHGDLPSNKDDPTLFQWVRAQRKRYAKGMMEDDRAALLDGLQLDRDWKVTPMSAFEKNLARLKTFVKANGHAVVSSHDDKKIATWLRKQRVKKQSGELNKSKINHWRRWASNGPPRPLCWMKRTIPAPSCSERRFKKTNLKKRSQKRNSTSCVALQTIFRVIRAALLSAKLSAKSIATET